MIELLALLLGLALLGLTLWDVFETIVVPRPTPGWIRLGRYAVRGSWWAIRPALSEPDGHTRDRLFGLFTPAATILLLIMWRVGLSIGLGIMLFGLRASMQPAALVFRSALDFAATSVL